MKIVKSGFTLIELMISISIIGILAAIIINGLQNSRARAFDSRIKQQLSGFRTAAEVYFTNQTPNSYAPATNSCTAGGTIFTDTNAVDGNPGALIDSTNLPPNTTIVCGSSASAFAVKATLYGATSYWCVDSKGISKQVNGAIGSSVTVCP